MLLMPADGKTKGVDVDAKLFADKLCFKVSLMTMLGRQCADVQHQSSLQVERKALCHVPVPGCV